MSMPPGFIGKGEKKEKKIEKREKKERNWGEKVTLEMTDKCF